MRFSTNAQAVLAAAQGVVVAGWSCDAGKQTDLEIGRFSPGFSPLTLIPGAQQTFLEGKTSIKCFINLRLT